MYRRILLLMDCSPVDRAVVEHIVKLAGMHGSSVHLFHVVHAHTLDQRRALQQKADRSLAAARTLFEEHGIEVTSDSRVGEPAQEVVRESKAQHWDLIAMATHGHKGLSDFILGSVSDSLKHQVSAPLLLIRGKT